MCENKVVVNGIPGDGFATSAEQAWKVTNWKLKLRGYARRQVLAVANHRWKSSQTQFVRCLYGHAIFPEHQGRLRQIIKNLKQHAEFIDTATLTEIIQSGEQPDGRFYHLSFDDGFANVFEEGGDVFADEQVPYSIFIVSDMVGADFEKMEYYNSKKLKYGKPLRTLTWNQVRDVIASGGEIGCHTHSHARLSEVSANHEQLITEIVTAKQLIENETGKSCLSFAWPFGKFSDIDQESLNLIQESGFTICFSAERGQVVSGKTDLFQVPRHQIELHWPVWENLLWAKGYRE